MLQILLKSAGFTVFEMFTHPTTRALKVAGTVRLRIFHVVDGGNWEIYDWDPVVRDFTAVAPGTAFDSCSHKTAGGVNTGVWENDTAINQAAFDVGNGYIFQFDDVDNTPLYQAYHVQWSSVFGDQAKDSTVAKEATSALIKTQTDKIGDATIGLAAIKGQANKIDGAAMVNPLIADSLAHRVQTRRLVCELAEDGTNLHAALYVEEAGRRLTGIALNDVELWNRRDNVLVHDFGNFAAGAANADGVWFATVTPIPAGLALGEPCYVKATAVIAGSSFSLHEPVVRVTAR